MSYTQCTFFIAHVAKLNIGCYMTNMSNGNQFEQLLADAADKIRREAYQQGWRDAIIALTKAAAEAAELPAGESFAAEGESAPARTGNGTAPQGITQGSTPWYVWQAVSKKPGMTGSELVSVVQEGGHKVPEGSIRTTLVRLKGRKILVSRHGKWFLA